MELTFDLPDDDDDPMQLLTPGGASGGARTPVLSSELKEGDVLRGQGGGEYVVSSGLPIGSGTSGKVYAGTVVGAGTAVAIKVIDRMEIDGRADKIKQLTRELNITRKLKHPNIINLLDLILNHCNFQNNYGNKEMSEDQRKQCIAIFSNPIFIESLLLGLKCDVRFVRQKFIKFVEMFVPYIRKFVKDNSSFSHHYQNHIEKLTTVFCELLRRVDVSFFSSTKKA